MSGSGASLLGMKYSRYREPVLAHRISALVFNNYCRFCNVATAKGMRVCTSSICQSLVAAEIEKRYGIRK